MNGDTKKKTPTKPKKKIGTVDRSSLIFFCILVGGIILLTIILLSRPTSKIYESKYGESITALIEVYSNKKVDIAVDVNETRIVQSGTWEQIDDTTYKVIMEGEDEPVTMTINDDTLILKYADGTEVEFKEQKK